MNNQSHWNFPTSQKQFQTKSGSLSRTNSYLSTLSSNQELNYRNCSVLRDPMISLSVYWVTVRFVLIYLTDTTAQWNLLSIGLYVSYVVNGILGKAVERCMTGWVNICVLRTILRLQAIWRKQWQYTIEGDTKGKGLI